VPGLKKRGESNIATKMRAVSVLYLVQGAAPGALTIVMPGGQPTAQEKEPESRGGGVELQGFCVYQSSTAWKSRGEGSGEGRHRAILCTAGTDGKRLMR